MDELAERGHTVRHNLERPEPAAWARVTGAALKRGLEAAGGYGGDFAGVLSSQRELNRADVVLSTVDTVGIPLMLLARARRPSNPASRGTGTSGGSSTCCSPRPRVGAQAGRRGARRGCRLDRSRPPPRLRAAADGRARSARDELPRRHDSGSRALPGRASRQRGGRDRPAVRRDAAPPGTREGSRASRAREQLLGRHDRVPAGDGAREARRRDPHGGDRDRLRARGRCERASRRSRGCCRETVESGLSWHRYVGRLEHLLLAAAESRGSGRSAA